MNRIVKLLLVAVAVLSLASCTGSFKDIKLTSCEFVSLTPKGLSSFDAVMNIGVDNPAPQITLSKMYALVKMDQQPCLHLYADDVTIASRKNYVYPVSFHGSIDESFNPFGIFSILKGENLESLTVDISFRGALKSGLGKHFEYRNLPLKDVLGTI